MSRRFAERTRLLGSVATATVMNWLRAQGGGGPTLQRGTLTLSAVQASNTATIPTAVVPANSVLTVTYTCDGAPNYQAQVGFVLTDSTTITGTRIGGAGVTIAAEWQVAEYPAGALRSAVQAVAITLGVGVASNTAALTALQATAKAVVVPQGQTNTLGTATPENAIARLVLTDTTTVTADRGSTGGATVVYGTVVEFT